MNMNQNKLDDEALHDAEWQALMDGERRRIADEVMNDPELKLVRNPNMADNLNNLNFNDLVPKVSQYLAKEDVGEEGVILTIRGFKREAVKGDDGEEEKIILHFREPTFADGGIIKPMILNRTNSQLIGVCTGTATAGEAIGKQIVVYNDPTVGFGGKITGGLRIRKVQGQPKVAAKAGLNDLDDSSIPF